jgi:hypothetical protein
LTLNQLAIDSRSSQLQIVSYRKPMRDPEFRRIGRPLFG